MEARKCFDELFERLGTDIVLRLHSGDFETKALIQPMRYKNKLYVEMRNTELGLNDTECFLYLGPAKYDFTGYEKKTAVFTANGERAYNVSRADRITIGEETMYIWAVLTPRLKEDQYDKM